MPIRIVDNKKLEMTDDEFEMYRNICASYDRENFKGADLFKNLFESDDNGIIMILKPPTSRYTSLEVFLFVASIMEQQHLRLMHQEVDNLCNQMKEKIGLLDQKLQELNKG